MRILFGSTLFIAFISIITFSGWASCNQDPTEPSIFCITPEEPIPGQFTEFEISSLLNPTSALWEFGDGHKESTLNTRFVEHKYAEPGRYVVKVWIAYEGGFDAITQVVRVDPFDPRFVPTPITSFDSNNNRRIDNEEFFVAVDEWIVHGIEDITFFKIMDAWIGHTQVVDIQETQNRAIRSSKSFAVYSLNGSLVQEWMCSYQTRRSLQSKLLSYKVPTGTYVLVERDCASNEMSSSFILAK